MRVLGRRRGSRNRPPAESMPDVAIGDATDELAREITAWRGAG
jgi:hypothetical protein